MLFFGNSHVQAVKRALEAGQAGDHDGLLVSAYAIGHETRPDRPGDIAFADLQELCTKLAPDDLAISMIGGNQHAVHALLQHPQPFDVCKRDGDLTDRVEGAEIIPRAQLKAAFEFWLAKDIQRITLMAKACPCPMIHLAAPPPKLAKAVTMKRIEKHFRAQGQDHHNLAPEPMRQRIWELQNDVLRQALEQRGIRYAPPPAKSMTEGGFLDPKFCMQDATHANHLYGTAVIKDAVRRALKFYPSPYARAPSSHQRSP